ncbi:long chain acyl-CoA synthetase 8-like [Centruroides sculpturatus]|uniref:long chain acyl-CoA synthetase 8-like n=1 Tax=Centruroides sculpturatus TaxID=218467 RepID=UPI000C6EA26C|nr:long chain acyl-CoA synthetase 8-like [Centruroides sculpturatus]
MNIINKDSVYLAYLPLAHIYEVMCEILFLGMGVGIGYSSSLTMSDKSPGIETGTCKGDISVLRPTCMSCVPLVLDRIRKSILEAVDAKGTIFRIFFNFAIKYKSFWKKNGFQTTILNSLVHYPNPSFVRYRFNYFHPWTVKESEDPRLSWQHQDGLGSSVKQ